MADHNKTTKKILMYGKHIAWIDSEMLEKLNVVINNNNKTVNEWIKKQCENDFSISLNSKQAVDLLDYKVKEHLYKDKSEWLRAKIREAIKKGV